jgi:outer membrane biosynthesis protein TonB
MNCENYLKLIDELIEDELDEKTADEVSLHIFDCQNCTAHFEMLEREKQIYSQFLFDIEPPIDLQGKFAAKLVAEEKAIISTAQKGLLAGAFAFLRFNPALTTAIFLILFAVGFVLTNLKTKETPTQEAKAVLPTKFAQPVADEKIIASATPEKVENPTNLQIDKVAVKRVEKVKPEIIRQPIVVKQTEEPKKTAPKVKPVPLLPKVDSEEMAQFKQLQTLELQTAKQLEKVELLLRSFRNAQLIEGSEMYDVSYETQQARRLLPTNIALRQKAEIYGTIFSEEMLSKVEPVLLDIANLEIDSTPEQVLEIKDRVRNQNIIASLQGF